MAFFRPLLKWSVSKRRKFGTDGEFPGEFVDGVRGRYEISGSPIAVRGGARIESIVDPGGTVDAATVLEGQ